MAVKFDKQLVLNKWLLSLFEVDSLEVLSKNLKDPTLEGYDENNISRFYHVLAGRLLERSALTNTKLLEYDQNIFSHTRRINERRERAVDWKYFQYLTLLFTEIYLDRYFADRKGLCEELNNFLVGFNEDFDLSDRIDPFTEAGLAKIAFWSATGSGKTLLMHVHLLQHLHYARKHNRERDINKIILITPNAGLSNQHLEEFKDSGINAEIFSKDGGLNGDLFSGQLGSKPVEILEISKLREDSKDKTVAVESFEGNNLVLIDEGHRGAGGKVIKRYRDMLSQNGGFAFEYSATFGQSIKAAAAGQRKELIQEYAKAILFDYSYRYFYLDGYGKDYRILNLRREEAENEEIRQLYLTAGLLTFYQQLRAFDEGGEQWKQFNLEKPLWIFVGGSVNAVRTQQGRQVSDVVDILLFLKSFIDNPAEVQRKIGVLLSGETGLHTAADIDIFSNAFTYLNERNISAQQMYADIMERMFHSSGQGGQTLYVENLKGIEGEIGLRVGDGNHFGVINVGDDKKLVDLCAANDLVVGDREFGQSLFRGINDKSSSVNLLIGSKKFSEGWSSWRVSLMGLMNIGRSEGSEIIQLFGRGVRLKGYDFSLKRSKAVEGVRPPNHIHLLETLNIFGVRADYMAEFKKYLEDEGLPSDETIEIELPTVRTFDPTKGLKVLRLRDGVNFKRDGGRVAVELHSDTRIPKIELDYYPKIEAITGGVADGRVTARNEGKLTQAHLAFLDWEDLYFEMQRFKNERNWYNVMLSVAALKEILGDSDWYTLYIQPEQLTFDRFDHTRVWQEVALNLLKRYVDALYKFRKAEWEAPHLEYQDMAEDDNNFIDTYKAYVGDAETELIEKINALKSTLQDFKNRNETPTNSDIQQYRRSGFYPFAFSQHLYHPLIHIEKGVGVQISVKPTHLNEGEKKFVEDLAAFYQSDQNYFESRELFLLRNKSKEGLGFFEAGNFYPDFIMWIIHGDTQHIAFIDPKGIRNLEIATDLKLNFHSVLKEKESQLGDESMKLHSFIISNTRYQNLLNNTVSQDDLEEKNILFQLDDGEYIKKIFDKVA